MVSEQLKQSFKAELRNLDFTHIEIELKEVGGTEGVFYHKPVLTRNPGVELPRIVSEGEQRCISIAAFFAELSTADDPLGHPQPAKFLMELVVCAKVPAGNCKGRIERLHGHSDKTFAAKRKTTLATSVVGV